MLHDTTVSKTVYWIMILSSCTLCCITCYISYILYFVSYLIFIHYIFNDMICIYIYTLYVLFCILLYFEYYTPSSLIVAWCLDFQIAARPGKGHPAIGTVCSKCSKHLGVTGLDAWQLSPHLHKFAKGSPFVALVVWFRIDRQGSRWGTAMIFPNSDCKRLLVMFSRQDHPANVDSFLFQWFVDIILSDMQVKTEFGS